MPVPADTNGLPETAKPKDPAEAYPLFLEVTPFVKGKPTCRVQSCYGRGYTGVDLRTGALIFCHCATIDQAGLDRRREEREAILRGYAKMTATLQRTNEIAVQLGLVDDRLVRMSRPWWKRLQMWLKLDKKRTNKAVGYSRAHGPGEETNSKPQPELAPVESSS